MAAFCFFYNAVPLKVRLSVQRSRDAALCSPEISCCLFLIWIRQSSPALTIYQFELYILLINLNVTLYTAVNFPNQVSLLIRSVQLTLRLLMSYIYGAPILDVSRSHTTTQHSR